MSNIGIRLANGEFYSILDDAQPGRKRVTLTTVQDEQSNVQIDILRKQSENGSPEYVGTLLLEDLEPQGSQPVDLELILGVDQEGSISARLADAAGTQYQSFSIEADEIDRQGPLGVPDFDSDIDADIGSIEDFEDGIDDLDLGDEIPDYTSQLDEGLAESMPTPDQFSPATPDQQDQEEQLEEEEPPVEPRPFQPLLLVAIVLISLSIVGLGAYLVFWLLQSDALPELTNQAEAWTPLLAFAPVKSLFRRQ